MSHSPVPSSPVKARSASESEAVLSAAIDRFFAQNAFRKPLHAAVGLSGGRDSVALFVTLVEWAKAHPEEAVTVTGLHVHHGLSPNADAWSETALRLGEDLGAPVEILRVKVKPEGDGIENAARKARYRAIVSAMRRCGATMLFTAHHRDDLIETFLLQWMRGAGIEGLAGMAPFGSLAVWGEPTFCLGRPFLSVSREEITRFVTERGLDWVEDESNADNHYARNRLRNQVIPALKAAFPHFEGPAARSIALCRDAGRTVREIAEKDEYGCRVPEGGFSIVDARSFGAPRMREAFRRWIRRHFGFTPDHRLVVDLSELAVTKETFERVFERNGRICHLYRGAAYMRRADRKPVVETDLTDILADEEAELWASPDGALRLYWRPTNSDDPEAVSLSDLRQRGLFLGPRNGRDRFHEGVGRPGRILKDLWAEKGIPAFDRPYLPVVRVGEDPCLDAGPEGKKGRSVLSVARLGSDLATIEKLRKDETAGPWGALVWATDFSLFSPGRAN